MENRTLKKRIDGAALAGSRRYDPSVSMYSAGKHAGYLRGFNDGAGYALSHQWISVDEALPGNEDEVLTLSEDREFDVSWLSEKGG